MSDRYRFEEWGPQGQDFQGGAPLSPEGVRAADHYLLAQLGARVLEILKARDEDGIRCKSDSCAKDRAEEALEIHDAARSLGLLEEKGRVQP